MLTREKEKKIKILCVLVIVLLVPAFVVYYEWQVAAQNNLDQMQKHATYTPVTENNIGNLTTPKGGH